MRFGPFKNEWLKRARLKRFKENCTLRLYRIVQGEKLYMYPMKWEDQISISATHEMHVHGFTILDGDKPIQDHTFSNEITILPGDTFFLDLSSVSFVIP